MSYNESISSVSFKSEFSDKSFVELSFSLILLFISLIFLLNKLLSSCRSLLFFSVFSITSSIAFCIARFLVVSFTLSSISCVCFFASSNSFSAFINICSASDTGFSLTLLAKCETPF